MCICDKEALDLPQAVHPLSRAQSPRPASDAAKDGGRETKSAYGCGQGLRKPKGLLPGHRIRANQKTFPAQWDSRPLKHLPGGVSGLLRTAVLCGSHSAPSERDAGGAHVPVLPLGAGQGVQVIWLFGS